MYCDILYKMAHMYHCYIFMHTGDLAELHDNITWFGGPASGNCCCQRKTRARGEEKHADYRECQKQATAQRNRGQDTGGPLLISGKGRQTLKVLSSNQVGGNKHLRSSLHPT